MGAPAVMNQLKVNLDNALSRYARACSHVDFPPQPYYLDLI